MPAVGRSGRFAVRRRGPRRFRALLASAAVAFARGAGAANASDGKACYNVLFETHWFTRDGATHTLAELPSLHANLRLCPAFNGEASCCRQSFEQEQSLHVSYWRQVLIAKLERLRRSRTAAGAVEAEDVFGGATPGERAQFHRAIEAYEVALSPASHSRCFAALMTYIAGMVCFSCKPDWARSVQWKMGEVIRVRIADTACTELWACCAGFAEKARTLRQAVLDSRLAILQRTPLENLGMFDDQQSLCDWAHDAIALHPFTTPGEGEREATPPIQALARLRRLEAPGESSDANARQPLSRLGDGEREASARLRRLEAPAESYDAIAAGRASGFDTTWGGVGAGGGARARPGAVVVALAAAALGRRGAA